jgi:hypothetical protein
MLENTIVLVAGLFVTLVILLMGVCTVGSIVAALCAVSRKSAASASNQQTLAIDVSEQLECLGDANCNALPAQSSLERHGTAEGAVSLWKPRHPLPSRE